MAFVDIIKPKSPMGVENRLRPYKRGEAEITSDVCYEVLQATNFGRSLRDMLDCMAKLPDEVLSGEKFKTILIAVMAGGNSRTMWLNGCGSWQSAADMPMRFPRNRC